MSSRWDSGPSGSPPASSDPAAAAAAAAARIAAQYGVKKEESPASSSAAGGGSGGADKKKETSDAPFQNHFDVNDVKNRYLVTKAATQQRIHEETGASLTTKGIWYPDRNLATADNPALFIHVEAQTQEMLDQALAKIQEVIDSEAPQLIEERGMRGRAPQPSQERPLGGGWGARGGKWPEEKIAIGLDTLRNFNVRAKIVGPGGIFVKYIQAETGTRVQIKGRGSGYIETDTGREGDEDMHINIAGPDEQQMAEAKRLALDLLDAVSDEWEKSRVVLEQQGYYVPPARARGGSAAAGQSAGGAAGAPTGPAVGGYGGQGLASGGYGGQAAGVGHGGYGAQRDGAGAATAAAVPAAAAKSPEEEALDKYWADYIKWEDSFKAYHGRLPSKEDGGQDVPPQYRK